jgi:hypothetical protein
MYGVVDYAVAVGKQPEEVGDDEAEHADQEVYQAHRPNYYVGDITWATPALRCTPA